MVSKEILLLTWSYAIGSAAVGVKRKRGRRHSQRARHDAKSIHAKTHENVTLTQIYDRSLAARI